MESEHPRGEGGKFGAGSGGVGGGKSDTPPGPDGHKWIGNNGERQLPQTGVTVSTPISQTDVPLYQHMTPDRGSFLWDKVSPTTVKLNDLTTMQPMVEPDRLHNWDPDKAPPIEVAKYRGEYIITQGNHRAASAWAANASEIPAKILDLDDPKNKRLLKPKFRNSVGSGKDGVISGATSATKSTSNVVTHSTSSPKTPKSG